MIDFVYNLASFVCLLIFMTGLPESPFSSKSAKEFLLLIIKYVFPNEVSCVLMSVGFGPCFIGSRIMVLFA